MMHLLIEVVERSKKVFIVLKSYTTLVSVEAEIFSHLVCKMGVWDETLTIDIIRFVVLLPVFVCVCPLRLAPNLRYHAKFNHRQKHRSSKILLAHRKYGRVWWSLFWLPKQRPWPQRWFEAVLRAQMYPASHWWRHNKMCDVYRTCHRIYASTKRARRKLEKANSVAVRNGGDKFMLIHQSDHSISQGSSAVSWLSSTTQSLQQVCVHFHFFPFGRAWISIFAPSDVSCGSLTEWDVVWAHIFIFRRIYAQFCYLLRLCNKRGFFLIFNHCILNGYWPIFRTPRLSVRNNPHQRRRLRVGIKPSTLASSLMA